MIGSHINYQQVMHLEVHHVIRIQCLGCETGRFRQRRTQRTTQPSTITINHICDSSSPQSPVDRHSILSEWLKLIANHISTNSMRIRAKQHIHRINEVGVPPIPIGPRCLLYCPPAIVLQHNPLTRRICLPDIYSALRPPRFSTKPAEWEEAARRAVRPQNFGYVFGSAGTGSTYLANRAAFDHYRLRPRMLVNATRRDLSVDLFGTRHPHPLLVAPVGVQSIMHKDGEEATARACAKVGVPMILSTAATRSIEQVAEANGTGSKRWYQLYWPRPQNEEVTASLLNRAKANGYSVLVVTLDTFALAWRPTDLDHSYLPFIYGKFWKQIVLTCPF